MNAADAVYLLENRHIRVRIVGAGAVIRQSVAPGEKIPATKEVVLELSI
jgi:cell division protein FtsI (penicillin-binding protein 3)